jgi:hypothetical protein
VIGKVTPTQIAALNIKQFKQASSKDISKWFTNFDVNKISTTDVEPLVPAGWRLNLETGALTVPVDTKLTLRALSNQPVSENVTLPELPNLNAGLGLAGKGISIISGMNQALIASELDAFTPSEDNGIVIIEVEVSGDNGNQQYAYRPNTDTIHQVDINQQTVGVSYNQGYFPILTTPNGLNIEFSPVPQDIYDLSAVLNDAEVILGQYGDVLMGLPDNPLEESPKIAIFDAQIQPDTEGLEPGIHLDSDGNQKVVYSDGTFQNIYPTFFAPEKFIEVGSQFPEVEIQSIIYNIDGTFSVSIDVELEQTSQVDDGTTTNRVLQRQIYRIEPRFEVEVSNAELDESIESSITLNQDGTLSYTMMINLQTQDNNLRDRGSARQVTQTAYISYYDVDDTCVEIDGELVCDEY